MNCVAQSRAGASKIMSLARCFIGIDVSELLTRLGTVGKATINKVYDKILPPVSRFGGGGRAKKKQSVIEKLKGFFEKYFGIGGSTKFS